MDGLDALTWERQTAALGRGLHELVFSFLEERQLPKYVVEHMGGDWSALIDATDWFAPFKEWPKDFQRLFYVNHKTNPQRFEMFCFFWANGMRPEHSAFVTAIVQNEHNTYDGEAFRQLAYLVICARNPNQEPASHWFTKGSMGQYVQ